MTQTSIILIVSNAVGWPEPRNVMDSLDDVKVIAALSDIKQTRNLAAEYQRHVVIASTTERGTSTLSSISEDRQLIAPNTRVIMFASHFDPEEFFQFIHLGVTGYLLWSDIDADLLRPLTTAPIRVESLYMSGTPARAWH